jgi:hypothetical protein
MVLILWISLTVSFFQCFTMVKIEQVTHKPPHQSERNPAIYLSPDQAYHAGRCEPLLQAVRHGEVKLTALARRGYPGRSMFAGLLPEVSPSASGTRLRRKAGGWIGIATKGLSSPVWRQAAQHSKSKRTNSSLPVRPDSGVNFTHSTFESIHSPRRNRGALMAGRLGRGIPGR